MKQIPVKKKKVCMSKSLEDSISETISFVIKGKLTPIKPTFVTKKSRIAKKDLPKKILKSVPKKAEKNEKSPELGNEVNKDDKGAITAKEQKQRKAKREEGEVKYEDDARTKTAKKQYTAQKSIKKEALDYIMLTEVKKEEKLTPNVPKKELAATKPLKKARKTSVKLQQRTKVIVKKNQLKAKKVADKQVKIVVKSQKPKLAETKKQTALKNKRKTIENLMRQANKDLKESPAKCDELNSKSFANSSKEEKGKMKNKPELLTENNKEIKKNVKTTQRGKIKNDFLKRQPPKKITIKRETKKNTKSVPKKKIKTEDANLSTDDTSDELTLDLLRQQTIKTESEKQRIDDSLKTSKKVKVEQDSDADKKPRKTKEKAEAKPKKKNVTKPKMVLMKKRILTSSKNKNKSKAAADQRSRKMKLFGFWNGPKRHRVASLNALAKVHCLYENESRANLMDNASSLKDERDDKKTLLSKNDDKPEPLPARTLRSQPGLRAVGKHWDMHDTTSSSSEEISENESEQETTTVKAEENPTKPKERKKPVKRTRNRTELIMDLKDMVVRKRMASLNASAILAASYCVEKRSLKSPINDDFTTDTDDSDDTYVEESERKKPSEDDVKKEDDRKVIEVCATPNKKVAVIVNQDTDVTITGVYVNSTTRSTHHEGYCSIAGMQYRISATSHTQTAATAVATETILQSASSSSQENVSELF